LSAPILRT